VAEDTVDGLRRAAPRKLEVTFGHPADPAELSAVPGVTVTGADGPRITLDVTGEIGRLLAAIARRDPVDLTVRPADLDELFLAFYQQPALPEVTRAR
jgi:beta-exotoxin I transport system ATP-binding protein